MTGTAPGPHGASHRFRDPTKCKMRI